MSQMEERFSHPAIDVDAVSEETGPEVESVVATPVSFLAPMNNIEKGRRVLELCIDQGKVLCVKGYVDSQIERGGACRDVVLKMKEYVDGELGSKQDRKSREVLRELQVYLVDALAGGG